MGEKHLRYVPNSNHSMADTDIYDSVDAWYHSIVHNVATSLFMGFIRGWNYYSIFYRQPEKVLLWQANNPDKRNFTRKLLEKPTVALR